MIIAFSVIIGYDWKQERRKTISTGVSARQGTIGAIFCPQPNHKH